ncbi:DUF6209 family protein [Myxococcus stipitatus]|uniref:DUF6209 family protein n=1 Tax=Myxococcus stipitatus TaxID=83455 RepID=UPI001F34DCE3|nr:DUF6209 family protein [Myxococcus stipitatus]MCE9668505.1 DUF6209 family protein [Myxococcus stipitatus]
MLRRHVRWLPSAVVLLIASVAVSQSTPNLTFKGPAQGWSVSASPTPLPYGGTASVVYDVNRLTQCRGNINATTPGWTITGYYQFNGGPVQSFWVAGFSSTPNPPAPSIPLGARGDLSVWFENTNRWGCQAWDSNYGDNFHFTVQ